MMLGLSLRMWSSFDSSCCLIFSSPSDSLVESLLAVLQSSEGVGQVPAKLLQVSCMFSKGKKINLAVFQMAKKLAEGNLDILQDIQSSAVAIKALVKMENATDADTSVKSEIFSDEELQDNNENYESLSILKLDEGGKQRKSRVKQHRHECDICEFSFTQSWHLTRHKRLKHFNQSEDSYTKRCKICDPKDNNPDTKKHYNWCHKVSSLEVHPCKVCWEWFPKEEDVRKHTLFHGDDPSKLYCNLCPHKCAAKFNIRPRNSLKDKNGSFIPVGQLSMNEHLKEHDIIHQCEDCGIVFPLLKGLKSHMLIKHKQDRGHTCEHCGKLYMQKQQLKNHIEMQHGNNTYECDQCDGTFATKDNLRVHKKRVHDKETIVCYICAKPVNKLKFKRHLLHHNGEKTELCDYPGCNKGFIDRHSLREHVRMHSGQKPFKCDLCDASFKKPDHRNKHRRLHTGERPHVCQYCGKGFIQKCNMECHQSKCRI